MDFLANLNKHERDANISFDAGPHKYTIKDKNKEEEDKNKDKRNVDYTSVTTWTHTHFSEFNADAIISTMMKGKGWSKSKYFGQSPTEIKAGWDLTRDEAAAAGTLLHYQIECYYNGCCAVEEASPSVEYTYFLNFIAACPELKPYRTEWTIYDEEVRIAGSVDMVYENPDGTLMIYDWKRAKDIVKSSSFMKYAKTECISHLPDTNFWHYALQLNTYKTIIEQKYGKKVVKLALVCLHPIKKNFEVIVLPMLTSEMEALFALRLAQVQVHLVN
jgi:hypothetical protein